MDKFKIIFILFFFILITCSCTEIDFDKSKPKTVNNSNIFENDFNLIKLQYGYFNKMVNSINNYSCKITVITNNSSETNEQFSKRIWVKENKIKVEPDMISAPIIYWDFEKNEMYIYDSENNMATTIQLTNNDSKNYFADFWNSVDIEKTAIIENNHIEYALSEYNLGQNSVKVFSSLENNLPVKMELYEENILSMKLLFTNYKLGKVTEEMVSLPEDVDVLLELMESLFKFVLNS